MGGLIPPWLLTLFWFVLKMTVILALAPVGMMYMTWLERKVMARMQDRIGPNRVGPYGLLQPLADGIKMLTKEDIVPTGADALCHLMSPIVIVVPALCLFTLLPFGPGLTAAPLTTGLLLFVALGSTSTLALFMGGWSSRSIFPLLGAVRNAAQLIAYEVPFVLTLAAVPMIVGSLNMQEIVRAQQASGWFIFTPWGFFAFILLMTAGLAEVNRTPFDLPEAESEIVGGFHTEYSGMKFALWYMAEYLSTLALGCLLTVLFFGGWTGPRIAFLPLPVEDVFWTALKVFMLVFSMIWVRGTFPRFRVDQLMGLAWKVLIPMSLANLLGAAVWYLVPGAVGIAFSFFLAAGTFLVTTQLWLKPKPQLTTKWVDQSA